MLIIMMIMMSAVSNTNATWSTRNPFHNRSALGIDRHSVISFVFSTCLFFRSIFFFLRNCFFLFSLLFGNMTYCDEFQTLNPPWDWMKVNISFVAACVCAYACVLFFDDAKCENMKNTNKTTPASGGSHFTVSTKCDTISYVETRIDDGDVYCIVYF